MFRLRSEDRITPCNVSTQWTQHQRFLNLLSPARNINMKKGKAIHMVVPITEGPTISGLSKNFNDLLTILLFFFLSIFVFIFSIGSDKEILKSIGIGILWSLLLLSSTLSLKRYYQEDFENHPVQILYLDQINIYPNVSG